MYLHKYTKNNQRNIIKIPETTPDIPHVTTVDYCRLLRKEKIDQ